MNLKSPQRLWTAESIHDPRRTLDGHLPICWTTRYPAFYAIRMTTVTVQDMQDRLLEILDAAERGEEVVIVRDGRTLRIVASATPRRTDPEIRLGIFAGQAIVHDPNWDAPLTDDELREMLGDDYVDG